MIHRFEQFTTSISAIYRFIQKIERDEMEKYGLKGAYAQYLLAMDHHPEGITAAALCEVCDRNKAAVSRILSEMEQKGLIQRTEGQYRARLLLSESGKEAAAYVRRKAATAAELVGNGLSDQDRAIFYQALELFTANIQSVSAAGLPDNHN
ncbi:MAG: MarR family transcriptional regulator [Oscillospiraceae bacterium]|nr:MarR family transcriptional regulator [Oscillospiraceae bacterium]